MWLSESPSAGGKGFPVGADMVLPWERLCGAKILSLHAGGSNTPGQNGCREKRERK